MNLRFQKKIASQVLGCGVNRVWIDPKGISRVAEALTKDDIRMLIEEGLIKSLEIQGISRARISKDKKRGPGSLKGKKTARYSRKDKWINRIRALRFFIDLLRKEKVIDSKLKNKLYNMASGGYFHSKRHLYLYLQSNQILEADKLSKVEELLKKSKELRKRLINKR